MILMPVLVANPLQKAVYGLLTRNLTTKTPIYDYVTADSQKTYITIGDIDITPKGSKDIYIAECIMDFNIYSDYMGRSKITEIAEDIVKVLMGYKIKMNKSGLVVISKENTRFVSGVARDEDGYVASVEFKFSIQSIKRTEESKIGTS